jgi:hypothetical protein
MTLKSIEEFIRYTTQYNISLLFNIRQNDKDCFACLHQAALIGCDAKGFITIQDYLQAGQNNFPDAATFYEAQKGGYAHYDDFALVKEAGIHDITVFEKMKKQGYINGYTEYKELVSKNIPLPGAEKIINPMRLYIYATENFFTDYGHFKAAWGKGFTDARTYAAVTEKGFKNADDYRHAQKTGIVHGKDFYLALELKIRDREDMDNYMNLEYLGHYKLKHDERVLVSVLSKLPQGKKISINKLNELLQQAIDENKYKDTQQLPEWFSVNFQNPADITSFLAANDTVKKFGTYDKEGEYFETKHFNERKVVIDGANIAHGSSHKGKATVENMMIIVNELKKKGFSEIVIIADASLRHRLTDKDKLPALEKMCEYMVAPADNPADVFLISYVKLHRCLVITNDMFRDWKIRDPWVAENIDYYKMSFMIDGKVALLPDLEAA